MNRKFDDTKLVLASHNLGKLREFEGLLAPFHISLLSAAALNLPEPEETGRTFTENATLKAQAAASAAQLPALADDSGLSVSALGGAPGIYSARWAGPEKDFQVAMQRVEDGLMVAGNQDRSAAFICVLALAWPDGHVETVSGTCKGKLVWPPKGGGGFGYDPIFVPVGLGRTFAEISPDEKKQRSHRAKAFRALTDLLARP